MRLPNSWKAPSTSRPAAAATCCRAARANDSTRPRRALLVGCCAQCGTQALNSPPRCVDGLCICLSPFHSSGHWKVYNGTVPQTSTTVASVKRHVRVSCHVTTDWVGPPLRIGQPRRLGRLGQHARLLTVHAHAHMHTQSGAAKLTQGQGAAIRHTRPTPKPQTATSIARARGPGGAGSYGSVAKCKWL